MHSLPPRYLFLELIQGAFWVQNGKNDGFTNNVSRIVKIVHSAKILALADENAPKMVKCR